MKAIVNILMIIIAIIIGVPLLAFMFFSVGEVSSSFGILALIGGALAVMWLRNTQQQFQKECIEELSELREMVSALESRISHQSFESAQSVPAGQPEEAVTESSQEGSHGGDAVAWASQLAMPGYDTAESPEAATDLIDEWQAGKRSSESASTPPLGSIEELPSLSTEDVLVWLQKDWLLKLGALLILIAVGWFMSYAFANDWISPGGRITLGLIAGLAVLVMGYVWMARQVQQGAVFLTLGATVLLLTMFASRQLYDFFDPTSSLLVMFGTTAFVAFVSYQYKLKALAYLSLIGACIVPLMTANPDGTAVGLFSYLVVVMVGNIGLSTLSLTPGLVPLGIFFTLLYSIPFFGQGVQPLPVLVAVLAGLFYCTSTLQIQTMAKQSQDTDNLEPLTGGIVGLLLNVLWVLIWILTTTPEVWQVGVVLGVLAVFVGTGLWLYSQTQDKKLFYIYALISIALLVFATVLQFDGATLAIALTLELLLIPIFIYMLLKDIRAAQTFSWLLIGPVVLSFESIASSAWRTGIIHGPFWTVLILALSFFTLGMIFYSEAEDSQDEFVQFMNTTYLIVGSIYIYVLIWLMLHASLFTDSVATLLALSIYTVVGISAYVYGVFQGKIVVQVYGGILIGCVVLRLLMVDVWAMDIIPRVLTFFIIGALLMSTAFIRKLNPEEL